MFIKQSHSGTRLGNKFGRAMVGLGLAGLLLVSACAAPALSPPAQPSGEAGAEPAESAATAGREAPAGGRPVYSPEQQNRQEVVTAGVTDDNAEFADYLDYRLRHRGLWVNDREVAERSIIQVVDERGFPVHDAEVIIHAGEQAVMTGRTDAGGRLLFHPLAMTDPYHIDQQNEFRVLAQKGYVAQSQTFARYSQEPWTLTLTTPPSAGRTQLDLLFLIDATGSMGDEIDKLKSSMADVADQIAQLPEQPDVRYGLVAYRDRGDAFVVRPYDFTYNLSDFQNNLAALRADGGGDTPESLNEALHVAVNQLSWRNDETVRLVILVADAPPHLDYGEPFSYDTDMIEAVRRGIKILPVGASNLDETGEYVFRQLAQFTGGKFVFLTYAEGSDPSSGPGTETEHDVENYSVDTLDRLVVRLVRDELAKLSAPLAQEQPQPQRQPPSAQPTPTPILRQPLVCTIDLVAYWSDCGRIGGIEPTAHNPANGDFFWLLDPATTGYSRARFTITFGGEPVGQPVLIGDVAGSGAQVKVVDGALLVLGDARMPTNLALDGSGRLLYQLDNFVQAGETVTLEIAAGRLGVHYAGGIEVVDSPYLFVFDHQADRPDRELHIRFNPGLPVAQSGGGISQVVITQYPAQQ